VASQQLVTASLDAVATGWGAASFTGLADKFRDAMGAVRNDDISVVAERDRLMVFAGKVCAFFAAPEEGPAGDVLATPPSSRGGASRGSGSSGRRRSRGSSLVGKSPGGNGGTGGTGGTMVVAISSLDERRGVIEAEVARLRARAAELEAQTEATARDLHEARRHGSEIEANFSRAQSEWDVIQEEWAGKLGEAQEQCKTRIAELNTRISSLLVEIEKLKNKAPVVITQTLAPPYYYY
jgi:uncharacterized small protein (DUF1192 family)